MILRLDPRVPRVWRDPHTLQFGVDRVLVVLNAVSLAEERIVHALAAGISRTALDQLAGHCGIRPIDVDSLLERIAPAMEVTAPPGPVREVELWGGGGIADLVDRCLTASGAVVHRAGAASGRRNASPASVFGVAIGAHVIDPRVHRHWLRRDIPHLAAVVGDASIRIGPLVEPGVGACLHCMDRHRNDADPAWTAMATQLLDRRVREPAAVVTLEAAALISRSVLGYLDGGLSLPHTAIIDSESGAVAVSLALPHPDCGCRALPGTDSVDDPPCDSAPERPRTAKATVEHG